MFFSSTLFDTKLRGAATSGFKDQRLIHKLGHRISFLVENYASVDAYASVGPDLSELC